MCLWPRHLICLFWCAYQVLRPTPILLYLPYQLKSYLIDIFNRNFWSCFPIVLNLLIDVSTVGADKFTLFDVLENDHMYHYLNRETPYRAFEIVLEIFKDWELYLIHAQRDDHFDVYTIQGIILASFSILYQKIKIHHHTLLNGPPAKTRNIRSSSLQWTYSRIWRYCSSLQWIRF